MQLPSLGKSFSAIWRAQAGCFFFFFFPNHLYSRQLHPIITAQSHQGELALYLLSSKAGLAEQDAI